MIEEDHRDADALSPQIDAFVTPAALAKAFCLFIYSPKKNTFCLIWIAIQQSPPPPPQSENTATATVAAYLERRSVPGASIFVLILSTT